MCEGWSCSPSRWLYVKGWSQSYNIRDAAAVVATRQRSHGMAFQPTHLPAQSWAGLGCQSSSTAGPKCCCTTHHCDQEVRVGSPVSFRIKILLLIFTVLNGLSPKYTPELLAWYLPSWSLRPSNGAQLITPKSHFETKGDRAFSVKAPRLQTEDTPNP